jgi:predicted transcriptional regulator YdeE
MGYYSDPEFKGVFIMEYNVKVETLPEKEFLVIKGYLVLGGNNDAYKDNDEFIRNNIKNGSIKRLRDISGSNIAYTLFCNTVVENEKDIWTCSNDIACENINKENKIGDFEIIKLKSSEYAVFECENNSGMSYAEISKRIDDIFWGEWLNKNNYICAIDDFVNGANNGYAAIGLLNDPDIKDYKIKTWYPIWKK